MTRSRRAVLIASLVATAGLTLMLGVTDPAPPASYPTRFFVWNEHKPNTSNAVDYAPMTLAQAGRDNGGGYLIGSFQLT